MLSKFDGSIRNCSNVFEHAQFKTFAKNITIFSETDKDKSVFFILEGEVKVTSFSSSGKEVWYNVLSEGQSFGEMAAISNEPRTANITSITKTKVAILSQPVFLNLLQEHGDISMYFMKEIVRRLSHTNRALRELVAMNINARFSLELIRRTKEEPDQNGEYPVSPWASVVAMASEMNTKRETISRTISEYENLGIIRREGRKLIVIDRKVLLKREIDFFGE